MHPISQRFLAQFPEDDEPLCAAPIRPQNATTDRYLLIGSLKGLWVCDLMPNLETSVRASSLEDSVIIQVWTGTVKQLEVCRQRRTVIAITPPLEDPLPPGSPASGSTSNFNISHPATGSDQVRVWPLQSLLNLVKYRTLAPQSVCVHHFTSKRSLPFLIP